MEIKKYEPNKTPNPELIGLLQKKYGESSNFNYFIKDYRKAFGFCVGNENVTFIPFTAYDGKELVGHIALIIDRRLPPEEAFFGFVDVENDFAVLESLWANLVEEAKKNGVTMLKGPVNGSIWHQYRCIKETDGSDFFKSELFCEPYYYNFFNSLKPNTELTYNSGYREGLTM